MLLSARILVGVANVNTFEYAPAAEFTEGDGPTIYLQLVDASLDKNMRPAGRRYVPADGSVLEVVFHSVDSAKTVLKYAVQPFENDPSVWAVSILPTDPIRGTYSLKLTLSEGTKVTRGHADMAVKAWPNNRAM